MTQAEWVAALAGNDGSAFPEAFKQACANAPRIDRKGDLVRYEFADGSTIIEAPGAWDLEGPTRWSWQNVEDSLETFTVDDQAYTFYPATINGVEVIGLTYTRHGESVTEWSAEAELPRTTEEAVQLLINCTWQILDFHEDWMGKGE